MSSTLSLFHSQSVSPITLVTDVRAVGASAMSSATPAGGATEGGDLSAYERERLETIRQNHSKLVELGLEQESTQIREATDAKRAAIATYAFQCVFDDDHA